VSRRFAPVIRAATVLGLTTAVTVALGLPGPARAAPTPVAKCQVNSPDVTGASGLGADPKDGSFYVMNDGVDGSPRRAGKIYKVGPTCQVLATIAGPRAWTPRDPEDMFVATDGLIWIADIGDNRSNRPSVAFIQIPQTGIGNMYRFTYPDGKHDAEALLVDRNGQPYIVTKDFLNGNAGIYTPAAGMNALVSEHEGPQKLKKAGTVSFKPTDTQGGPLDELKGVQSAAQVAVTGGAVSQDGTRVVLRTYTDAYEWFAPDFNVIKAITTTPSHRIPLPGEHKGEGIAYSPDNKQIYVLGDEKNPQILSVPSTPESKEIAKQREANQKKLTNAGLKKSGFMGLPMVVWYAIGGIAFGLVGLGLLIAGFVVYRRERRRARAGDDPSGGPGGDPYDDSPYGPDDRDGGLARDPYDEAYPGGMPAEPPPSAPPRGRSAPRPDRGGPSRRPAPASSGRQYPPPPPGAGGGGSGVGSGGGLAGRGGRYAEGPSPLGPSGGGGSPGGRPSGTRYGMDESGAYRSSFRDEVEQARDDDYY
jgi:hypothetical protein